MSDFSRFSTLSFDCYGTLIDWETGIAAALRPWAARNGLNWGDEELIAAHARFETVVQREDPTSPYPRVLAEVMRRIGHAEVREVTEEDATAYGNSVAEWPAFPDSADALLALSRRFRLVILSNVDRASFAASNDRLQVEFDLIVTAEDAGSYKPDPASFIAMFAALAEIDVPVGEVLHVAESIYHDHEPAQHLGLPSVWIHRRHGKTGQGATAMPSGTVNPTWRFESMAAFATAALS